MRRQRGVALLVVLMLVAGLLIVGQMAMLLLDNVTTRSGTFRRIEQGQYCAEEGLNLGRAWVMQNAASAGYINNTILTGVAPGGGLLVDPSNPADFSTAAPAFRIKDLCEISSTVATVIGAQSFKGLQGMCRTIPLGDPNSDWCGAPPCPMYRINLVDDMDEPPPSIDPYTDHNYAFFIRSECMAKNINPQAVTAAQPAQDQVAFVEVNEAGGTGCPGGNFGNNAGCGGGYHN